MAQCGKCGKPLNTGPNNLLAFDPGHYCQPLLPGARQITVTVLQTGDFIVGENGLFVDHLCWGEMIEQIINLTHPSIRKQKYPMLTPQELGEQDRKWGANVTEA